MKAWNQYRVKIIKKTTTKALENNPEYRAKIITCTINQRGPQKNSEECNRIDGHDAQTT